MAVARARHLDRSPRDRVARRRHVLADGARTTVYVATYDAPSTDVRVAILRPAQRLEPWCAARGIADAIVGGFFVRPGNQPLGELRTAGVTRRHVPFDAPYGAKRACLHVQGGRIVLARRDALPENPRGALLQAGPLLLAGGKPAFDRDRDVEGFRRAAHQFDSDITDGRHPRAALGLTSDAAIVAVACDGRSRHDAGLTLGELADLMAGVGCVDAINLDGGGSTSLVSGGRLRNRPRRDLDVPEPGGRSIATAIAFLPRRGSVNGVWHMTGDVAGGP
jgi:hypothetical protein